MCVGQPQGSGKVQSRISRNRLPVISNIEYFYYFCYGNINKNKIANKENSINQKK